MSEYQVYVKKYGLMVPLGKPHPSKYLAEHQIRKYIFERYGRTIHITPVLDRTKFLNSLHGNVLAEIREIENLYTHKMLENIIRQKVIDYVQSS